MKREVMRANRSWLWLSGLLGFALGIAVFAASVVIVTLTRHEPVRQDAAVACKPPLCINGDTTSAGLTGDMPGTGLTGGGFDSLTLAEPEPHIYFEHGPIGGRADTLEINGPSVIVFDGPILYSSIHAPNAFRDPDGKCYSLNVLHVDGKRVPVECPKLAEGAE